MIILDTSVWIEFLCGRSPYLERVEDLVRLRQVLALPWVFGELLQGARSNLEVKVITDFWNALPKPTLEFCEQAWIRAGVESQRGRWMIKGVGLIDGAIVVAAMEFKASVWSLDKSLNLLLRSKKRLFNSGL